VQLRYYDHDGERQTGGVFATRSAAFAHYRDAIEPRLRGERPELTLAELVELYLERHTAVGERDVAVSAGRVDEPSRRLSIVRPRTSSSGWPASSRHGGPSCPSGRRLLPVCRP
jgi:hypothetical protein